MIDVLSGSGASATVVLMPHHDDQDDDHTDTDSDDDLAVDLVAATMEEIPYVSGPLHGQMARRLPPDEGEGTGQGQGWWPAYRTDSGGYLEVMDPEEPPASGYVLLVYDDQTGRGAKPNDVFYLHLDHDLDEYSQWWHSAHPGQSWSSEDTEATPTEEV